MQDKDTNPAEKEPNAGDEKGEISNLGANLRLLRQEVKLSQQDMATYLGISQSMISRLERDPESMEIRYLRLWIQACLEAREKQKGYVSAIGCTSAIAPMIFAAALLPPLGFLGAFLSYKKGDSFEKIMAKIGTLMDLEK